MAAFADDFAAVRALHTAGQLGHGRIRDISGGCDVRRRDGSLAGTIRATLTLQLAAVRVLDAAGRLRHGFIGRSRVRNRGSSDDNQQSSNSKCGKGSGQHGGLSIEIGTAHDMRVQQQCE